MAWVDEFKEKLMYIVAGTPDQYLTRLLQKEDVTEDGLESWLFVGYELGRDHQERRVTDASKKILQTRIPDVEQRLPFYEVMFDIMDKGLFIAHDDLMRRYELDDNLFHSLHERLCKDTKIENNVGAFYVRRFSRDLAAIPGAQYNVFDTLCSSAPRQQRVAMIADYLHRPMKKVVASVLENRSSAAVYYDFTVLKRRKLG